MTHELAISTGEAQELDRRIDQAFGDGLELLATAFRTGAWYVLNYPSWDSYLATKAGVARQRIPAGERAEVFARLRDSGMSDHQIAAAVGVSQPTVSRSFSDTNVSDNDLEQDDDVLTEAEWQAQADDDEPEPDPDPDPDLMAGHPDPDIGRQIDELKDSRFAANVQKVFYAIAKAEARLDTDRIAEVAARNFEFEKTLRDDIAESERWLKKVKAAIAVTQDNVRTIRRVK